MVNPKWKRVNRDDIRLLLDGQKFNPKNEKFVSKIEDAIIVEALKAGKNVVVDATNLHPKTIPRIKKTIADAGITVLYETKHFDIPVEEAVKRDVGRVGVGHEVIWEFANKYLDTRDKYTPDKNLEKAYIFDVDGSLATMNGRSPFDWERVKEDKCREEIAAMARNLYDLGYYIIIMSGRDGSCKKLTEEWFKENRI